ncbi:MAG: hypothetical protein J7L38_03025 [Thermoproteales archaeon]|nr:hypothetical protein [Thermoproteales archaeon]
MRTATLSIRIREDLKVKMRELKGIDWRREIEEFIERRIREIELMKTLEAVREALKGVSASREPAWKTIRELRERR